MGRPPPTSSMAGLCIVALAFEEDATVCQEGAILMKKRVVGLGGGFGGLATAQHLDHMFRGEKSSPLGRPATHTYHLCHGWQENSMRSLSYGTTEQPV